MKVAVLGLGRIGQVHIQALQNIPDITIISVSDIDEKTCKIVSEKYNIPTYTTEYSDIINNKKIDAVWVCSPSNLHYLHVNEALKKGKYVFCEKPLETDKKRIQNLLNDFKNIDKRLMVGFNRRFDQNFSYVKNHISKIGKPTILKITSRDPTPPPISYVSASGGIFMDMTIHDLDMALFMINSSVKEVYATGAVNYVPEMKGIDLDTALITLTFENGVICNIDNSRKSVYGYDQRLEILGDQGMLSVNNKKVNQCEFSGSNDIRQSVLENFFLERYKDSYLNECHTFYQCYKNNTTFPVTARDALNALVLAEACKQSVHEKRGVLL